MNHFWQRVVLSILMLLFIDMMWVAEIVCKIFRLTNYNANIKKKKNCDKTMNTLRKGDGKISECIKRLLPLKNANCVVVLFFIVTLGNSKMCSLR